MAQFKWRFEDLQDTNPATKVWTLEQNPREMTSPFGPRNIVARGSVAVGGQMLAWEGNPGPVEWEFRGRIRTKTAYDEFLRWSKKPHRFYLYDHFGRRLTVVLTNFNPAPKTDIHRYWSHEYSMSALVFAISSATVGEVWN